jgi:hypothetical protein
LRYYGHSVYACCHRDVGFLRDAARAGLSETERDEIITMIARDPTVGDVIPGTGGARKLRVAGRGKGKSGGYRIISYFAAEDVPVLLLVLIDKRERTDLTQSERNALRDRLGRFAVTYREGVQRRLRELRKEQ